LDPVSVLKIIAWISYI